MKIAGLQKLSLVDYPKNICAIIFTQGCNFRCPYCQNPDLVEAESEYDFPSGKVLEYLTKRKKMLEGVVISGGEPTVQRDLPEFIKSVKELGYNVKLDTNGTDPVGVECLIQEGLIDYLALDIKTSPDRYFEVTGAEGFAKPVLSTIDLILKTAGLQHEFRTTCVPGLVTKEDIEIIAKIVKGAQKYCLQQFRPEVTLDKEIATVAPYKSEQLEMFKTILQKTVASVEIRGI